MSEEPGAEGERATLAATHTIEYPYTRSLGPAIGRFLTGLRDGYLLGSKTPSGEVHVPPLEFDPKTAHTISDFVRVADCGVVTSWTWIAEPRTSHQAPSPFAFALVRLDGADHGFLHRVEVSDASAMTSGMRVKARWAEERSGSIWDIACFVPE